MGSTTAEYNAGSNYHLAEQVVLRPSDQISFTQDSISNMFCCGRSLMETMLQVAGRELHKRNIPMIRVVYVNSRYYSLDNRRLAVFRVLEFCGMLHTVKCRVEPWSSVADEYRRKKGSYSSGDSILIRNTAWQIGRNVGSTSFPYERVAATAPMSNRFTEDGSALRFLADITDE